MNTTEYDKSATRSNLFKPRLTFYHPNAKGTGCAMQLELHPAEADRDGCIMMGVACQMSVGGNSGGQRTFARFDWKNAITVKLDFSDLCKMLQVFRGECESIEEGRGLYHRSARSTTRIVLRHLLDPVIGYSLEVYRTSLQGEGERHAHIVLNAAEALGLCESISGSMSAISFGVPSLSTCDAHAPMREREGMCNEHAA